MKITVGGVACGLAAVLGFGGVAIAQDAVQWRVEDGGNGHWYLATADLFAHFWSAQASALAKGGHLVTLTTHGENAFVASLAPHEFILGGFQDTTSQQYAEPSGGWRWVTEEPWTFAAWREGEPQNGGHSGTYPGEHFLSWWRFHGQVWSDRWNDIGQLQDDPNSQPWNLPAIIEWSADCNGDGIVDYGQILDGTLEDANGNGVPDCCDEGVDCDPCLGDVNFDGIVNGADISVLLGFWGLNGKPVAADINKDGQVDGADLAQMLGSWGECP